MPNIKKILQIEKEKISPDKNLINEINNNLKEVVLKIKNEIKKTKIKAEVFIGGSFAKGTIIKKDKYEIDLFLRFDKKYREKLSEITEQILKKIRLEYKKLHGSRDYFQINTENNILIEIIPVVKISRPKEAENITDLSYFHVNYVKKHLNKKIIDEIKLAKTFTHAQNCYGAESYIKGFSGYALELLMVHYKSFEKFLHACMKTKEKIFIFNKKDFKNKQEILLNLNQSKLESPIVLIDPTFKERNVLAALSQETFEKFKTAGKKFLKNPSEKFFEQVRKDFNKIIEKAKKNKKEFIRVKIETDKQEGDVAGSKLLKFYNFLLKETEKYFKIKSCDFIYNEDKTAEFYIVIEKNKDILIRGPPLKLEKHVLDFRKKHKNAIVKKGILYSKEKNSKSLKEFLKNWRSKNERKLEEMYIKDFIILN
ncbi:MAG: hypothetical protein AABY22_14960 [Nanoarchaeota archaeon]